MFYLIIILIFLNSLNPFFAQTKRNVKSEINYLNRDFSKPLFYNNCLIYSKIFFRIEPYHSSNNSSPNFNNIVSFNNSKIFDEVIFDNCTFNSFVSFQSAQLNKYCEFNNCTFKDSVNFSNLFASSLFFNLSKFFSSNNFNKSRFSSTVHFKNTYFKEKAFFKSSRFSNFTDFSNSTFSNGADFSHSKFLNQTNFYDCSFNGYVSFNYVSFNDYTFFRDSYIPDYLDLRFIERIEKPIDFTTMKMNNNNTKCKIALYGSDIGKIKINLRLFELDFRYPEDQPFHKTQVIERLLKKFLEDGNIEDYNKLTIFYKDSVESKENNWYYFRNSVASLWWNHGYTPYRVFIWSLLFLLFFTFINYFFIRPLNNNVYNYEIFNGKDFFTTSINTFKGKYLFLRLFYSFVYTTFIFFDIKLSINRMKDIDAALLYIVFIYLVGLICVVFMAKIVISS